MGVVSMWSNCSLSVYQTHQKMPTTIYLHVADITAWIKYLKKTATATHEKSSSSYSYII